MIEGVLRHGTEMIVDRQYVDRYGQSEVPIDAGDAPARKRLLCPW